MVGDTKNCKHLTVFYTRHYCAYCISILTNFLAVFKVKLHLWWDSAKLALNNPTGKKTDPIAYSQRLPVAKTKLNV